MATRTLAELRQTIKREVPFIGVKPFSHNIIGIALQMAAERYGTSEANKLIDKFDLEDHGWKKVDEGKDS